MLQLSELSVLGLKNPFTFHEFRVDSRETYSAGAAVQFLGPLSLSMMFLLLGSTLFVGAKTTY